MLLLLWVVGLKELIILCYRLIHCCSCLIQVRREWICRDLLLWKSSVKLVHSAHDRWSQGKVTCCHISTILSQSHQAVFDTFAQRPMKCVCKLSTCFNITSVYFCFVFTASAQRSSLQCRISWRYVIFFHGWFFPSPCDGWALLKDGLGSSRQIGGAYSIPWASSRPNDQTLQITFSLHW